MTIAMIVVLIFNKIKGNKSSFYFIKKILKPLGSVKIIFTLFLFIYGLKSLAYIRYTGDDVGLILLNAIAIILFMSYINSFSTRVSKKMDEKIKDFFVTFNKPKSDITYDATKLMMYTIDDSTLEKMKKLNINTENYTSYLAEIHKFKNEKVSNFDNNNKLIDMYNELNKRQTLLIKLYLKKNKN